VLSADRPAGDVLATRIRLCCRLLGKDPAGKMSATGQSMMGPVAASSWKRTNVRPRLPVEGSGAEGWLRPYAGLASTGSGYSLAA
jgi:hypothetical protein